MSQTPHHDDPESLLPDISDDDVLERLDVDAILDGAHDAVEDALKNRLRTLIREMSLMGLILERVWCGLPEAYQALFHDDMREAVTFLMDMWTVTQDTPAKKVRHYHHTTREFWTKAFKKKLLQPSKVDRAYFLDEL